MQITENRMSEKYEWIRSLGRGASSEVYLVRHRKLEVYRAVKCISKQSQDLEWSLTEAMLLKNLDHPGIPQIYDVEEDEEYIYLIEEYVRGESLQTLMSESYYFSKEQVIQIAIELCHILEYLHAQTPYAVVYQDLKPEHIYWCEGKVRLIDFGIAEYLSSAKRRKQGYGTPGFAAPEQYDGIQEDILADVYSLGAVIYALLFGDGSQRERRSLLNYRCCDRDLRQFFKKTLAKDPKNRFQSVEQARQVLEQGQHKGGSYRNRRKMHLAKKYVLLSPTSGCGTTYLSVTLTERLRRMGVDAVYCDDTGSGWLERSYQEDRRVTKDGRYYWYRDLLAIQGGKESRSEEREERVWIVDLGCDLEKIFQETGEGTRFLCLLDTRPGMEQINLEWIRQIQEEADHDLICSFGREKEAQRYAKLSGEKVYCFPLDNGQKKARDRKTRFFQMLFEK